MFPRLYGALPCLFVLAACGIQEGTGALILVGSSPSASADEVAENAIITLRFSEEIDKKSLASGVVQLTRFSDRKAVPASVTSEADTVTLVPTSPLEHTTRYAVVLQPTLRGASGSTLAAERYVLFVTVDKTGPRVVSAETSQRNESGELDINGYVSLHFDEPIMAVPGAILPDSAMSTIGMPPDLSEGASWPSATQPATGVRDLSHYFTLAPWETFTLRTTDALKDLKGNVAPPFEMQVNSREALWQPLIDVGETPERPEFRPAFSLSHARDVSTGGWADASLVYVGRDGGIYRVPGDVGYAAPGLRAEFQTRVDDATPGARYEAPPQVNYVTYRDGDRTVVRSVVSWVEETYDPGLAGYATTLWSRCFHGYSPDEGPLAINSGSASYAGAPRDQVFATYSGVELMRARKLYNKWYVSSYPVCWNGKGPLSTTSFGSSSRMCRFLADTHPSLAVKSDPHFSMVCESNAILARLNTSNGPQIEKALVADSSTVQGQPERGIILDTLDALVFWTERAPQGGPIALYEALVRADGGMLLKELVDNDVGSEDYLTRGIEMDLRRTGEAVVAWRDRDGRLVVRRRSAGPAGKWTEREAVPGFALDEAASIRIKLDGLGRPFVAAMPGGDYAMAAPIRYTRLSPKRGWKPPAALPFDGRRIFDVLVDHHGFAQYVGLTSETDWTLRASRME